MTLLNNGATLQYALFPERRTLWRLGGCGCTPAGDIDEIRIEIDRPMSEFRGTAGSSDIGFRSLTSRSFIGFASEVFPICVRLVVSNQIRKHDVDKTYVSRIFIQRETGNDMPPRVPVVALTAFTGSDRSLYLQSGKQPAIARLADQIGISLVVIMLVWREARE